MGYIILILVAILLVPIVYLLMARKPAAGQQGQEPIGKPVLPSQPAADEPTPDASSIQKNTSNAQRHTPAA